LPADVAVPSRRNFTRPSCSGTVLLVQELMPKRSSASLASGNVCAASLHFIRMELVEKLVHRMAAASDGQGGPVPDHQVPPNCRQRRGVVAARLTIVVQTGACPGVPETIHLRRNNTGLSYTGWKVRRGLILCTCTTFDPRHRSALTR